MVTAQRLFEDRNHPILARLVEFAAQDDEEFSELLKDRVTFYAPKTLFVTFRSDSDANPAGENVFHTSRRQVQPISDPDIIQRVADTLRDFSQSGKLKPRIVLDLRKLRFVDLHMLKTCFTNMDEAGIPLFVLLSPELRRYSEELSDERVSYHGNKLEEEVTREIFAGHDEATIELAGEVTLQACEQASGPEYDDATVSRSILVLDLTDATGFDDFALFSLKLLLESVSAHRGIVWEIRYPSDPGMRKLMLDHGFAKLTRSVVVNPLPDTPIPGAEDYASRVLCSLTLPWGSSLSELSPMVNRIIFNTLRSSYDRLDERRSWEIAPKHSPLFPVRYRIRVSNFIKLIIHELTDNAMDYSQGSLHLTISDTHGMLQIMIGDLGVGLRAGILKNYDLAEKMTNNEDTLKVAFNLPDHQNERKKIENSFDSGGGLGLSNTLRHVFRCGGRLMLRTGNALGLFLSPVTRSSRPSKILQSGYYLAGTQFLISIPLNDRADKRVPHTWDEFLRSTGASS